MTKSPLDPHTHGYHRAQVGTCNLCGKVRKLTWDHVPPSSCFNEGPVEIQGAFQRLVSGRTDYKYTISQNGLKYRTICKTCNNELLGRQLDPHLEKISRRLSSLLRSKIILKKPLVVTVNKPRLARAVLAHMCSAKVYRDECLVDQAIRDTVFELDGDLPEKLHLYYWIYPYSQVTSIRDVAMPAVRGDFDKGVAMFSILKFYPLGFLLTNLDRYESLQRLDILDGDVGGVETELEIALEPIRDKDWPEMVEAGNFVMGGLSLESATSMIPRIKKR